jgi:hypothetical protein
MSRRELDSCGSGGDKLWTVVNAVINSRVPLNAGKFGQLRNY